MVCVSGKTGVGPAGAARRPGALRAAAGRDRAHGEERGRRRGRGQGRSGRPAGGPGVQDPHRPVRAEAQFHPRLLGHAEEGRDRAGGRRAQGRQARRSCCTCRPTRPSRSTRPAPAGSWPWPRSKTCTPASSLGELTHAADPVPHADGRPGRHARRAAATKASSPARCTRSARRTPPSAAISTRRPRKWSSPA